MSQGLKYGLLLTLRQAYRVSSQAQLERSGREHFCKDYFQLRWICHCPAPAASHGRWMALHNARHNWLDQCIYSRSGHEEIRV